MNNISIKKLKTQDGCRVIISSKDGCRTEIHFDIDGNQLETWVDRKFSAVKTKVHSWVEGSIKFRKLFLFDKKGHHLDKKRVMFVD